MVLVYHNITPPRYFVGVHKLLVRLCYHGRRELGAYVHRCDLALGDSEFNRQELEELGFPATGVLPVVPGFAHLDGPPNDLVARLFDDEWTNVLFVGRVIPNKRIENVIRSFAAYKSRCNHRSRLLIVGSYGGFERYLTMLQQLAARLGVGDVHFTGHVSNEELTAYYDVADVFLCASEHEGFCVPLVEAMAADLPILAYSCTAIPDTLGGAGVQFAPKDFEHAAELLGMLAFDDGMRASVIEGQRRRLAGFLGGRMEHEVRALVARFQS
jgi:glycosyltransferase involved in cell wall biosynthesis